MAVTIDASVGGVTANSYVTSAEVDAYAEASAYASAWAALGVGAQNAKSVLIVRAARIIDTLGFVGYRASSIQALQWPRYAADSPDGGFYLTTVIPAAVKNAQMELAGWAAAQKAGKDPSLDPFLGLESIDVGSGAVKLGLEKQRRTSPLQDVLSRVVTPILRAGLCIGPTGSVRLTR